MKIVSQSFTLDRVLPADQLYRTIELAGRTCYKSEERIGSLTHVPFIEGLIRRGHLSVLEHISLSVRIVTNRAITHELVRHRLFSFSQSSTRYCNLGGKDIEFISPWYSGEKFQVWKAAMQFAEESYNAMLSLGAVPQEARSVLPNDLKTEIVMTGNLRSWRHFFELRCDKASHPQMVLLAKSMLKEFNNYLPLIFKDLKTKFLTEGEQQCMVQESL